VKAADIGRAQARRDTPKHIVAAGIIEYELTKLDEQLIRSAVWQFFEDAHPVPVYLLACSAREILTTIGDKAGVETNLHAIARKRGYKLEALIKNVHAFAGFFKHADRNPTEKLCFRENEVDHVLMIACDDFGRITTGMPVEAQVYQAWCSALAFARVSDAPLRQQTLIKFAIKMFPGIRRANRQAQKNLGLDALNRVKSDPDLQMQYSREVIIASGPLSP
jgi:hypothetical protein